MFSTRSMALLAALLLLPNASLAQPKYAKDVYQDFRKKAPLRAEFRLTGPGVEKVATPEDAGFRITLPKDRKDDRNVQVIPSFILTGDFEITGTYELLSADIPTDGWGVGVAITLSGTPDMHKFFKVGLFLRPKTGRVFMAEYFTEGANDWQGPQLPTNARSGQLRMVREGTAVRGQVSEGPGQEFATIFEKADFGAEALPHLKFVVSTGNKLGYAVDARLVDLRVRYGNVGQAKAADDPVAPVPVVPINAEPKAESRSNLLLLLALGMMLMLALAITLGLFLFLRRGAQKTPETDIDLPAAAAATLACTSCGKRLTVKSVSAGKRVKCPKCGEAVVVPSRDEADA